MEVRQCRNESRCAPTHLFRKPEIDPRKTPNSGNRCTASLWKNKVRFQPNSGGRRWVEIVRKWPKMGQKGLTARPLGRDCEKGLKNAETLGETRNLPVFGTIILQACRGLQSGHCEPIQRNTGLQCIIPGLQQGRSTTVCSIGGLISKTVALGRVVVESNSPTGTGPGESPGASAVLDARIARDCPRGSQPVTLGDWIENLGYLVLSLYGMVDAVIGTFTVPQLKTLVRTLRRMGFKSTVLTGRKAQIAESIREAATGHLVTLRLGGPALPDEMVREWAHAGAFGPVPGARAIVTNTDGGRRLVFDEAMLIQDGLSPSAVEARMWVNTQYDASLDPDHGTTHRVARGVMQTGDRFTCNRNEAWLDGLTRTPDCITPGGVPSCVPGTGRDASTAGAQIVGGVCPVCSGRADTPILRHGVSEINGRFVHAVIIRPNGSIATAVRRFPRHESVDALRSPIRAKNCRSRNGRVYARVQVGEGEAGVDGWDYAEIEVREWIGADLRPVHMQKVGGRHAMKVNGRTCWVSGSMVRCVVGTESFGDLLAWVFFCNHDADDRTRYPDYDPTRLNAAAGAVVNAAARAGISTAPEVKTAYDEARRAGGVL